MNHFLQRLLKYLILLALEVIAFFFSFYFIFFISRYVFLPLWEKHNIDIVHHTQSIKAFFTVVAFIGVNIVWASKAYIGKRIEKALWGIVSGSMIIVFYLLQPDSIYPIGILYFCQIFLWELLDATKVLRMKYY